MRLTKNKKQILEALRAVDDREALETGQAPFSAKDVQEKIGGNLQNIARTLRSMEDQGLVVSETVTRIQWFELNEPTHYEKARKCYWSVPTMDTDREVAKRWNDGKEARQERAWEEIKAAFFS
jgi:CTP-dependent riboflavin kinase